MSRYHTRGKKPVGAAPGTVVYIGDERFEEVVITNLNYSHQQVSASRIIPAEECQRPKDLAGVSWYTIDGVHDPQILQVVGERFKLHPLVLEDIANTQQRPKIEDFEDYIFIAMKMISLDKDSSELEVEHVSLILGKGFVLAFLEDEGDLFEPIRQRIASGKGRMRHLGADYLAYTLMDAVIDNYFTVLEELGERIEAVEEEVVESPNPQTLKAVHLLKRELIFLRRSVWPMRETVNSLLRDESELVTDETRVFLRDLYDHTIHVIDTVETLRDIVAGMLEVYLSSVSNKLNQVMKVLTVMSSIFIPLTFVVGIYGMNFQYMPELTWRWGYPLVMSGMAGVAGGLLILFKRKDWL